MDSDASRAGIDFIVRIRTRIIDKNIAVGGHGYVSIRSLDPTDRADASDGNTGAVDEAEGIAIAGKPAGNGIHLIGGVGQSDIAGCRANSQIGENRIRLRQVPVDLQIGIATVCADSGDAIDRADFQCADGLEVQILAES